MSSLGDTNVGDHRENGSPANNADVDINENDDAGDDAAGIADGRGIDPNDNDLDVWHDSEGVGRIAIGAGGFLDREDKSRIVPGRRAQALKGIMQEAETESGEHGILSTLGHGNLTDWLRRKVPLWTQSDGLLGGFKRMSVKVVQRHLGAVKSVARKIWGELGHSTDRTGAAFESIDPLFQPFFRLFDAAQNAPNVGARQARLRETHRQATRGLIGAHAPFGAPSDRPAALRTETHPNARHHRSRSVGNVTHQVEGLDDVAVRRTPTRRTPVVPGNGTSPGREESAATAPTAAGAAGANNGFRTPRARYTGIVHRNIHTGGFSPDSNDPSSRFDQVASTFGQLRQLGNTIDGYREAAQAPAPRTTKDNFGDYLEIAKALGNEELKLSPIDRQFMHTHMGILRSELQEMTEGRDHDVGGSIHADDGENTNESDPYHSASGGEERKNPF